MDNRNLKVAVSIAVQTGIAPIILWGDSGSGKSKFLEEILDDISNDHEYGLVKTFASDFQESIDFRGIPVANDDHVIWIPPHFVKKLWDVHDHGKIPVLFIDEFSHASTEGQAAMMKLLLDKLAGENPVPDNTRFILASNKPDDLGGNEIMTPLKNRAVHLFWEADNNAFVKALIAGKFENPYLKVPDNWRDLIRDIQIKVAGFLSVNPRAAYVNGEETPDKMSFPTHRSWWDYGIPLLAAARAANASIDVQSILLAGAIGNEIAVQFLKWEENLDLPKPEEVLERPEILTGLYLDQFYATIAAVAACVEDSKDMMKELHRAWDAVDYLFENNKKDLALSFSSVLGALMRRHDISAFEFKEVLRKFFDFGIEIGAIGN